MKKACASIIQFLKQLKSKRDWKGPTCTCRDFKLYRTCKHLEILKYKDALLEQEDSAYNYKRFGGNKTKRRPHKEDKISAPLRPPQDDMVGIRKTFRAVSNHTLNVREDAVLVPENLKWLDDLVLLDSVGRNSCGRYMFRATISDQGIVLAKVLKLKSPTCLPSHNDLMNNELDILSRLLPHPNIVEFYGYDEVRLDHGTILERRTAYEFCVDTLGDLVSHRATGHDRLSYLEVRKYSIDIAEALEYLHHLGIAHRDLSSDNIFMVLSPYPNSANWNEVMKKHFRLSRSFASIFGGGAGGDTVRSESQDSRKKSGGKLFGSTTRSIKGFGARSLTSWKNRHNKPAQQSALKPYNMLDQAVNVVGPNLIAKVGNFEVAARVVEDGRHLRCKTRVTSAPYAPPEMFKGESYDESCDIWALGTLMYEMLAKERPFAKHYNLTQIEEMVCNHHFPPKSNLAPYEFKPLETVMHNCCAYDSEIRPDATQVLQELRRLVKL